MNNTVFSFAGAIILVFLIGLALGYWLVRWKERAARAEINLKEQALLESAKREAQTITREARLAANELALQMRSEVEQQIAARHKEIIVIQQRLSEREALVSRQMEDLARKGTSSARGGSAMPKQAGRTGCPVRRSGQPASGTAT